MRPPLYLKQIEVGPMENFVYFVGDQNSREVFLIDPAWQVDTLIKQAEAEDLKIKAALITHHHHDHTNGIEELLENYSIPVYVNRHDLEKVKVQKSALTAVDEGQKLKVGKIEVEILHTPGHTKGSQCFIVGDSLISGDTLFINGCGRCDFPDSDPTQMYYSLTQKLMRLPGRTLLYPGHNYAATPQSTIGEQMELNPFIKMASYSLNDFLKLRIGR